MSPVSSQLRKSPKCTINWVNYLKESYIPVAYCLHFNMLHNWHIAWDLDTEDKTPCKINEILFSNQQLHLKRSICQGNRIVLLKPAAENPLVNKIENLYCGVVAQVQLFSFKRGKSISICNQVEEWHDRIISMLNWQVQILVSPWMLKLMFVCRTSVETGN